MPDIVLKNGYVTHDARLDRLVEFDLRSRNFPVQAKLTTEMKPRSYTWRNPIRLDQGNLGACVSFSWHHELAARPVQVQGITNQLARERYCLIQAQDYWDGASEFCGGPPPHYEGTSVLAGAKVLQGLGLILEYRWAFTLADVILAVGHLGPGIAGTKWLQGMMNTDAKGYIHATGPEVGGHGYCVNRVNIPGRFFGISQTWGTGWGTKDTWGLGGTARLSFDDMEMLLADDGEFCVPMKRKL